MASKTITPNDVFAVAIPVDSVDQTGWISALTFGGSTNAECVVAPGDGKYFSLPTWVVDEIAESGTPVTPTFAADPTIPKDAVIVAGHVTFRYAKTYIDPGDTPFNDGSFYWGEGIDRILFPEPPTYVTRGEEPVEANWQEYNLDLVNFSAAQQIQMGRGFQALDRGYLDWISFFISFPLTAPTIGTITFPDRFTDRVNVKCPLTVGGVTSTYPVSYYFEWTEQNPTGGALVVTHLGSTTVLAGDGSGEPLGLVNVTTTIPEDSTTLPASKTIWVRLIAYNADGAITGAWTQTSTLANDEITI
jgi:hypothetical protein